jgi:hypothetical protein
MYVGTPVDQVEDETDVALLPLIPLPDDHHLHPWMRPNLVRKAELALSVAESTRLAQLKSRDEVRQSAMKVLIAQTKEYQDLALSPMHESMRKAYNESLTKTEDFALEVASAGGKTAAALRRYRWSQQQGAGGIVFLASCAQSAAPAARCWGYWLLASEAGATKGVVTHHTSSGRHGVHDGPLQREHPGEVEVASFFLRLRRILRLRPTP